MSFLIDYFAPVQYYQLKTPFSIVFNHFNSESFLFHQIIVITSVTKKCVFQYFGIEPKRAYAQNLVLFPEQRPFLSMHDGQL